MIIGVDYFSSVKIVDGTAQYTGGANYVKSVLKVLKGVSSIEIVLYVPSEFSLRKLDEMDADLFSGKWLRFREINKFEDINSDGIDVLFFPQVNGNILRKISKIKEKNPNTSICATLHDRQHNFYRFDPYDRYYQDGYKRCLLYSICFYYAKKIAFDFMYNKKIKSIDKVFTVSNYSMQKLMDKNVHDIKYFIQPNYVEASCKQYTRGDYILFVGAGRPEKNLLRTLVSYSKYIKNSSRKSRLVVTGVSSSLIQKLSITGMFDKTLIERYVEFLGYVSYEELSNLYSQCRYVLFTSKGEGYGLPVREAIEYGKTVIASRTTSVPEVVGPILKYVDPFDVDSMYEAMLFFDVECNLNRYEGYITEKRQIVNQIAKMDMRILIDELVNV